VRQTLDSVANVVITVVALVMMAVFLHDRRSGGEGAQTPSVVKDWEEHNRAGIRVGHADVPFVVTEFMDFTCPYCRMLSPVTDSLLNAFPQKVAVVFHHFPLPNRPLALESAIAAECAHEQGRFGEMYKNLFASGNQAGLEPDWSSLARASGVANVERFSVCLARPANAFPRIEAGRRIGEETGVRGTPTVWVNGRPTTARTVRQFSDLAQEMGVDLRN